MVVNASGSSFPGRASPIWDPKLIPNRVRTALKSNRIGFQTQSDNLKHSETNVFVNFIKFRNLRGSKNQSKHWWCRSKKDFAYIRRRTLSMMHWWSILLLKMVPQLLPNRFQSGSKRLWKGLWMRIAFWTSKKTRRSRPAHLPPSSEWFKLVDFGPSRGRERGRGQRAISSHAGQPCPRQGSADYCYYYYYSYYKPIRNYPIRASFLGG